MCLFEKGYEYISSSYVLCMFVSDFLHSGMGKANVEMVFIYEYWIWILLDNNNKTKQNPWIADKYGFECLIGKWANDYWKAFNVYYNKDSTGSVTRPFYGYFSISFE